MDVVSQIDLKLSSTWWSNYLEGHLQTSPAAKKEEWWQLFFLWLTPTALSRSWPCSSLDSHFFSRQGSSPQLLDLEFLGLERDIVVYEGLQQPFQRPHIHVMWARGPTNLYFEISIDSSLASLPLHRQLPSRFQRKLVPRRRKTSTTMTNPWP
jgi:hypothetical protein